MTTKNKPIWLIIGLIVIAVIAVLFSELIVRDTQTDNIRSQELTNF